MKNLLYYLPGCLFSMMVPAYVYIAYPEIQTYAAPESIWRFAFVFFIFFLLIGVIFFILLREHLSAGLVSTCLILGILYPQYPFSFITSAILLASILLAILKRKFELMHPYAASMLVSIVITIYIGMEYAYLVSTLDAHRVSSMVDAVEIKIPSLETSTKPDIYYIILDAYAGETMLNELHGFDNSSFTSALRKRGFILPSHSRSNYLRTIHSLSSSLNMQYLHKVEKIMGGSSLWWPLQETFTNNETRKFLESQGYQTVVIASGWDFTTMTDADTYKQPYPILLNKFEEFFIGNTNLSLFGFSGDLGVSFPSYDTHRQLVSYAFEQLRNTPELDSPKFTFVHIISPHPPFVFDSEGSPINPDYPFTLADNRYLISPPSKYQTGYLNQLSFVNSQILGVVDAILEKSATPPIIIIQGDHGPGIFIDAESLSPPCFYERYSILNAYYLPGIDPNAVPQDITPVNTFRLIFNDYFSEELEFLPNRQYFSPPGAIYQFEDVTDRMNHACIFPPVNP